MYKKLYDLADLVEATGLEPATTDFRDRSSPN